MTLTIWGARGSVPCPGLDWHRYGGNTSCIEVRCGDSLIILDGGSGLRGLGNSIEKTTVDADLLLTHTHVDHIVGIPFFKPLYNSKNTFRFWAGHLGTNGDLHDVLSSYMMAPLFPIPPAAFAANIQYHNFLAPKEFSLGPGVVVKTIRLNHPQGATGYRIEFNGRSFCYITDHEHIIGEVNHKLIEFCAGTDLLIYDCTYTDEVFEEYIGWGHSTWQEGIRLLQSSAAKQLMVFHHNPDHTDEQMDKICELVNDVHPNCIMAIEGMELTI